MGRGNKGKTSVTKEQMNEICDRLAKGESLRSICKDKHMPPTNTVTDAVIYDKEFAEQYTRARGKQADYYADQIVEIADTADDYNLARIQIDARKWVASKLLPKRWGDKVEHEHTGDITVIIDRKPKE